MALRLCLLVSLIAMVAAQETTMAPTTMAPTTMSPTTMAPTTPEATTMAPTTMAETTMAPTTMAPTTMAPTTMATMGPTEDPIAVANENLPPEMRYVRQQAIGIRQEHFFCPGYQGAFIDDVTNADGSRTIRRWTVFLQYPVLAYLDSVKKMALFRQIAAIVTLGGVPVSANDFCVARVEHFEVSYYRESVLFHIYIEDGTPTVQDLNRAFGAGLNTAGSNLVTNFQGKQAIVLGTDTYGQTNQNVHPGAFNREGRFDADDDPTLRAVILGYWEGGLTVTDAFNGTLLSNPVQDSDFAGNPNPVFTGLTGGDVVFAVIGAILLSLLAFIMVFGFCIQPYFM